MICENIKDNKFKQRIGEERLNAQGCLMKIIEYTNTNDIIVEFQDKYKAKVHSQYVHFKRGFIKNPYYPSVYSVGITGQVLTFQDNKSTKEYKAWQEMLRRCFDEETKKRRPTYKDVTCCKEWLLFENFYNWLISQENYKNWKENSSWVVDKDIIHKGNKIYSPDRCCLVPQNINKMFIKSDATRGKYPIGISDCKNGLQVYCNNPITNCQEYLGIYTDVQTAFNKYKEVKEKYIKDVAKQEYNRGTITLKCYQSMMSYEVEITD